MNEKPKMKADEMQVLKAVSLKVSDDVVLIVTSQYHTEKIPGTKKVDHSKSQYRWLARAYSITALNERIKDLASDEKRLGPWHWPDDPSWNGKMFTDDSTNYKASTWLAIKLKKALPWEEGLKFLHGWDKKENVARPSIAYATKGYTATDGSTVDIDDREAVLKHVNQNFFKPKTKE